MSNVNEVIPNQSDHVISDRDHCSALQSVTETAGPAVTTDPTVTTDLIVATGPEVATGPTVTAGTIEPSPDTIDPVDTSNDSVTSSDAVFDKVARCGQDSARGEDYSGLFEHGPSGPADLVIPSMGIAQTQVKGKLRGPVRQWSLQMKLELVNRVMGHKTYTGSSKTVGEVYEDIHREFIENPATSEMFRDKKPSMLRSHWDQMQQAYLAWKMALEQDKSCTELQAATSEEDRQLKEALTKARDEIASFKASKRRKRGPETPDKPGEQERTQTPMPRWHWVTIPSRPEGRDSPLPLGNAEHPNFEDRGESKGGGIELGDDGNMRIRSSEPHVQRTTVNSEISIDDGLQEKSGVYTDAHRGYGHQQNNSAASAHERDCSRAIDDHKAAPSSRKREKIDACSSRKKRRLNVAALTEESLVKILEKMGQAEAARRTFEADERRAERELTCKRQAMEEIQSRERWEQGRLDNMDRERYEREERADIRRMEYDRERDARAERKEEREAERQIRREEIESRERVEMAKNDAFMKVVAAVLGAKEI